MVKVIQPIRHYSKCPSMYSYLPLHSDIFISLVIEYYKGFPSGSDGKDCLQYRFDPGSRRSPGEGNEIDPLETLLYIFNSSLRFHWNLGNNFEEVHSKRNHYWFSYEDNIFFLLLLHLLDIDNVTNISGGMRNPQGNDITICNFSLVYSGKVKVLLYT